MNGYVIALTSLTLFWWSEVTWVTSNKVVPTDIKIGESLGILDIINRLRSSGYPRGEGALNFF